MRPIDERIRNTFKKAWLNVFDEPTIASIQHQISALSTAMDGAYYRVHTDIPRPNGNTTQAAQNLDLPSQGIQAITYSLDYWKRAVKKICDEDNQQQITTPAITSTVSQAAQILLNRRHKRGILSPLPALPLLA